MSSNLMYQCELRKGPRVHVAWIEARGAKVGAVLELKLGEGIRDPGWSVTRVYGSLPEEQVLLNAMAFKYHRAKTDV